MIKATLILIAFFFSLSDLVFSQDHSNPPKFPPNIVWINVEDISPAIGAYGDPLAKTPNLDRLAKEGVLFRNAFSTAPICSPSRSSFIIGVYSTTMGTQHLRSEIPRPGFLKTLPEVLKEENYFTTNYGKTDWNFNPDGVFDLWNQDLAPWRNRPESQPFFSMFVVGNTHEGPANRRDQYQKATENLPPSFIHSPEGFPVPPIFPDNEVFRGIFARYYDLISQMDLTVGQILANLEADGLKENTVIFFFSDHGFGLPRYKRYLHRTGTQVPLLIYAPPAYQDWLPVAPGQSTDQLVSLVDLAPSVLNMLGIEAPSYMQGKAFLGPYPAPARDFIYLERSRADDLFEMSRAVTDGRYFYVRNYMPYLPSIRTGRIQGEESGKEAYKELARLRANDSLPAHLAALFLPKPIEELYDLLADPYELKNIADSPELAETKRKLATRLLEWSADTRDLGFVPEAEYMRLSRRKQVTPYELGLNYPLGDAIAAASLVGTIDEQAILNKISHSDGAVSYWAIIAARSLPKISFSIQKALEVALNHESPSVRIAAAEALLGSVDTKETKDKALRVLERELETSDLSTALQAARSLVEIGSEAQPVLPVMFRVQQSFLNTTGNGGKYKDSDYSSFIGWALERAIENAGSKPY